MKIRVFIIFIVIASILIYLSQNLDFTKPFIPIGNKIDSINGVYVFYNGPFSNISGRNLSQDGYNLGLKYQCVEFVKRYYYEHYCHKMPNSYGHAKDFFNNSLEEGSLNIERGLFQFKNPGRHRPQVGDILIYNSNLGNPYGHICIISKSLPGEIEIIQQNSGGLKGSRKRIKLLFNNNIYYLKEPNTLGYLCNANH